MRVFILLLLLSFTASAQVRFITATTGRAANPGIIGDSIPVIPFFVIIDNNIIGTEGYEHNYVGAGWNNGISIPGWYNGTLSYTGITNSYVEFSFNGTKIDWVTEKKNTHGIVAVSIDGGAETNVDLYSATPLLQQLVYSSATLTQVTHTIKLRCTGTKNASSSAYWNITDYFKVYNPLEVPIPPTPSGFQRYVQTAANGGSDSNPCTQADPCLTINYTIGISSPGDTIKVGIGDFIETAYILVPPEISIVGSGTNQTFIKAHSSLYYSFVAWSLDKFLFQLTSTSLTNGDQTLKDFTTDGVSRQTRGGIYVKNRRNVVVDFVNTINFGGNAIWLHNSNQCVLKNGYSTNSGWASPAYATGNIMLTNVDTLDIDTYSINEDYPYGYGIKCLQFGAEDHKVNMRLHHSQISIAPTSVWNNGSSPNIVFEAWQEETGPLQIELDHNTFTNLLSLVDNVSSSPTGTPSVLIHDNIFDITTRSAGSGYGIELSIHDVEINNNYFWGGTLGIVNWAPSTNGTNWDIHHNVFNNLHSYWPSGVIAIAYGGMTNGNISNNLVYLSNTSTSTYNSLPTSLSFIEVNNGADMTNVDIENNVVINIAGGSQNYFMREAAGGTVWTSSVIRYNFAQSMNGGVGGPTTGITYNNNATGTAAIDAVGFKPFPFFRPTAAGNLDQTGVDIGYPFTGTAPSKGRYEAGVQ